MYSSGVKQSLSLSGSYGNVNDVENAKLIARKLFELYDKDKNGVIDQFEISPMLQDTYRYMSRVFNPSKLDIESYSRILDRNGDGRVTLSDLETLCIRYLCGESPQTGK
mmetsp:Transcript_29604/g.34202  ORF Transcript_29604/g.34202 Transcript_29604/m.34202 type:complete len:109 (+) Transcript_29604:36-362(+)